MRTMVDIDEDLLAEAQRLSGITDRAALIRAALESLVRRESARRLARMGGAEPQLENIPRRQP